MNRPLARVLYLLGAFLVPVLGFAQYPQPTSLTASPNTVYRPGTYSLCAGNGANMTLDVKYNFNGGAAQTIIGWPSLNSSGCASIYADNTTQLGTFTYTGARNTLNNAWVSVNAPVTITLPPDFTLSVSPAAQTIGYGNSAAYTVSITGQYGFSSPVSLTAASLPPNATASFTPQVIYPGQTSTMTVNTSGQTVGGYGNYTVYANASGGGVSHSTSMQLSVLPPPQPSSMSFNSTSGYAGNTPCATATFGSGTNMSVDLQYMFQGITQTGNVQLNSSGQWQYCPGHNDALGTYTYSAMKNHWRTDWVAISGVSYTVNPPKPTSLSITPSSVTAGRGSYTMTAGNGGNVRLQLQYTLNGGATTTLPPWPDLDTSGSAAIPVAHCTVPGTYRYVGVKNYLNSDDTYLSINAPVDIVSNPGVTSVSPTTAARGATVSVTISGLNLCGVSLSTTWPGLTFTSVTSNGSSATATFSVSPTAWVGTAAVTLNASFGSTTFNFTVANSAPPVISAIAPSGGTPGTSSPVTITGANLTGASISTSWNGLTFSNVVSDPQGASLSATFNIAPGAAAGTPTIQVSNSIGSTPIQLFSIVASQPTSMSFSPAVGYAGNMPCTVATFGNSPNMSVDVQYTFQGGPTQNGTLQLDNNGQWAYCPSHNDAAGTFVYTAMKNHARTDWVPLNSVTYTVNPPMPTALSITPSSVTAGNGSYTMTAANGGNVRLQLQYKLNEGATTTLTPWPDLDTSGTAIIQVEHCTAPGTYRYVGVKNFLNGDETYVTVSAPVTITSDPAITSLSQTNAARGWTGTVMIAGRNLCGTSLSTTWPGLSFSNIVSNGDSVSATFAIAPNAFVGNAAIAVNATYGSTTFGFAIDNAAPPVINVINPSSGAAGTNVAVTITGANFTGASMTTPWSGLSFSNVSSDPQGNLLSATFNIAAGTTTGTPSIQITNSVGTTTTQLFTIGTVDPQPGTMTVSPTVGYAGNTPCGVFTFMNSANMLVDVQYVFQNVTQTGTVQLDGNGRWTYCPAHNDAVGTYAYTAIKNHSRMDWVTVSGVTYTVNPPMPTSLSITPSSVTAGPGNYTMSAGNGGNVRLQLQYRFNEGATITLPPWPDLDASGTASIPVGNCTVPGTYRYVGVKNYLNGDDTYVAVSASITISSNPTAKGITPTGAARGSTGTLTFVGQALCGVTLSTTWPGLAFTNVSSTGSSVTATFVIAADASLGKVPITVNASYGSTSFLFSITNGPPTVTAVAPSSGSPSSNTIVTLSGTNLTSATLSTSWSGLTFSNVTSIPQGTSLTATFSIANGTSPGTPSIQVTNAAGTTTTQLFSIVAGLPQPGAMTITPLTGYAGNLPCALYSFANSANMLVDLQYTFQGIPQSGSIQLDGNGEWEYCPAHDDPLGTFVYAAVKNQLRADWVSLNPTVNFTLNPPAPTSLSISPASVAAGSGSYTMTAGNGANVRLQLQYKFNQGAAITLPPWPDLDASATAQIPVSDCTPPGTYTYVAVKNAANGDDSYAAVSASVDIVSSPIVSALSLYTAGRGWSGSVTITGHNLCGVSLTTSWQGLSFSNVVSNGTSATSTFTVSSDAWVGSAPITLTSNYGTATFNFDVNNSALPVVTAITPSSGSTGTTTSITIAGANLAGATLSTSWSGLTISSVTSGSEGEWLSATFNITPAAATGTPPIQITNSVGSITTQVFSIVGSQPGTMTVNPATGYAGNTPCTVLTFANSPNMLVDVQYTLTGASLFTSIQLDANSQFTYCPSHNDVIGTYTYTAVKNHSRSDWIPISAVSYTLYPPKPTSVIVTPSSVIAGAGSYTVSAGNGSNARLQLQYKFNEGATITLPPWPDLDLSGSAVVPVENCTPPGTYRYVAAKNAMNADDTYIAASAPVNISSMPAVTAISELGAPRGWSGTVTINGRNLCGVALSTTWSGLTFSNVTSQGSSATATFTVGNTAAFGTATVTLTGSYGSTTFTFTVLGNNAPVVTSINPTTGVPGSSVSVVVTGINLSGTSFSTTWAGVTFNTVSYAADGTSAIVIFNVAATAPLGVPTIKVAAKGNSTNTQLFSIVPAVIPAKEYIYLGDRVISTVAP